MAFICCIIIMQNMRKNIVNEAVAELQRSTLTNYRIAKDIGVSDVIVAKWRRGECRPTHTNAAALLRYFRGESVGTPIEPQQTEIHNAPLVEIQQDESVGVSDKMISFLIDQCQLKDRALTEARKTIAELQTDNKELAVARQIIAELKEQINNLLKTK